MGAASATNTATTKMLIVAVAALVVSAEALLRLPQGSNGLAAGNETLALDAGDFAPDDGKHFLGCNSIDILEIKA